MKHQALGAKTVGPKKVKVDQILEIDPGIDQLSNEESQKSECKKADIDYEKLINQKLYPKIEMNPIKLDSHSNLEFICPTDKTESCFIAAHHFLCGRISFLKYKHLIKQNTIHSHGDYEKEKEKFKEGEELKPDLENAIEMEKNGKQFDWYGYRKIVRLGK